MKKNLLMIFVKYPKPGAVKTRLAEHVGDEKAAQIYKRMVQCVVENVSNKNSYRIVYYADPASELGEYQDWLETDDVLLQSGKDLGERLSNAFQHSFDAECDNVIAIGSDCIDVDADSIEEAFQKLEKHPVVLGPSTDGGYYLIGLHQFIPEIFDNISWSTSQVFVETVNKIRITGLDYSRLDMKADIDDWPSYQASRLFGQDLGQK